MRRLAAILLMLLVPLQFAWAAAQNLHGHLDDELPSLGFHYHDGDHDHHHDGDAAPHGHSATADLGSGHDGDDGHHGGHFHPVFSSLVFEPDLTLAERAPDGPPRRPPDTFTSHVPPPFDWPPAARV